MTDLLKGLDQQPEGVPMEDLLYSQSNLYSPANQRPGLGALRSENVPTPIILILLRFIQGNVSIAWWLSYTLCNFGHFGWGSTLQS